MPSNTLIVKSHPVHYYIVPLNYLYFYSLIVCVSICLLRWSEKN